MTFEFVSSSRKDPEKVACLRPSAIHCSRKAEQLLRLRQENFWFLQLGCGKKSLKIGFWGVFRF